MATIPYTDDYLAFYDDYPRHEGKQEGQKAWNTLSDSARKAAHEDVRKRVRQNYYPSNKKRIQLPASYLRAERWNDDWMDTLESSRKPENDLVSRGTVQYQPREDPFLGTRWTARANRRLLDYMMHRRGMPDDCIDAVVREKNRVADEFGRAFEEDLMVDSSRAARLTIAEDFDRAVYMAIERVTGTALTERLLRARR